LLGLLALLVGAVVTLLLYLNRFEQEEDERKRAADAQWLEQTVQFHFRRLEDDLLVLARQTVQTTDARKVAPEASLQGGLLWRQSGAVLASGWMPSANQGRNLPAPTLWLDHVKAHADNVEALGTMQATTQGLRRSAYAGLMRHADGSASDVVWLAVPFFDRGEFVGNYLAAVALGSALAALVPQWFLQDHQVSLLTDVNTPLDARSGAYRVALNLPGTDLFVQVTQATPPPTTVPRIFFLVALLFLAGMLVALYALRRDFVKRQQVQALLQAQVSLRSAMENSVMLGLRAWDRKGRILYVNEAFARMVGYPSRELIGLEPPFPYWPRDQIETLTKVHENIMRQGTGGNGVEVQFQHRQGHLIDVLILEAPLQTATGKQMGWMSSVLDISERKLAQRIAAQQQEKLEASGRLVAVGEVASTLAHELNQPLGALSSFANGLLNRLNDASITLPELLPVVERMARLAERAGGIIKRVNAFARQRELSRQQLDLAALLNRVLTNFNASNGAGGCALQWDTPPQPVWVDADELLLEHLVNNLVGNAQDWAPHASLAPQVWVELRQDTAQALATISVSDNGPGVAEDALGTIFNAFVSRKEGGMGMGLAICRSIVEAHNGRIEVSRDPLLGGARFVVSLPLVQPLHAGDASDAR